MDMTRFKDKRLQSILSLILMILLVLPLILLMWRDMEAVQSFIQESGWLGLLISVGIYGVLGLTPIPSEPLTVLLGTMFGPLAATIVAGTGNVLSALMEYYVGERIGNIASFEERRKKLPFGLGRFPVDSVPFLLFARMLPGYGPKFVSVLSGIYRVSLWRYLWTTAVSTFIGSAIFAYGGFELINLLSHR